MLGLGEHVARVVPRIAIGGGNDEDLGRACDEVDADFSGEELLGGGDVDVARSHNAIGARHSAGAEGKGGDGLCAAHLEDVQELEHGGGAEDFGDGARGQAIQTFGTPATSAGMAVIEHGGGRGITPCRNIGGDGIERSNDLSELQAGPDLRAPLAGQLALGIGADISFDAVSCQRCGTRARAARPAASNSAVGTRTLLRSS